ncbi:hypothetical protein [Marinobacter sp.]
MYTGQCLCGDITYEYDFTPKTGLFLIDTEGTGTVADSGACPHSL